MVDQAPASRSLPALIAGIMGCLLCSDASAVNLDQLDVYDAAVAQSFLARLDEPIEAKKRDGTANLLSWEKLYQPLSDVERAFVETVRALKAEPLGATSHYFGEVAAADLIPVGPQRVNRHGTPTLLDPQHLPREVHDAYHQMMDAMEKALGKRLLVESGYRSPAYQLYLFLFYLPKHGYSIRETNRFVALPGYSEHGYPPRQAIDFINQDGINGEDHPEEFEALPEYRWLQHHASEFGFALSYPRDNPSHTSFEPWHWHYERPHP